MSQAAAAPAAQSTPGASLLPDTTDIFTIGHLAIVALLAVLVVAGIIWGVRLSRRRHEANREILAHNREIAGEAEHGPATADEPSPPAPDTAHAATELLFEQRPDMGDRLVAPAATENPADAVTEMLPGLRPADDAPEATASAADGPVTQLKGLGPKLAAKLAENDITTVGQLAALTDDQAAALDARLGPFTGRMARDRWQEQARFLAAGDIKGFEAVFGRL